MSEAVKKINIDVGDVLKRGSNEVGMAELNKMGLTKVKVIRHSQVQELISQAVDNAISRFIFGAEGRKEHERLMSLISEKESALSDVSGAERSELKGEVELLKRQMQDQAQRLEEAKAKVIEETKKEYEALAEKTSLENQLIMQKKAELQLHQQLQEMTMMMAQLKEKAREGEKESFGKLQELEKLPILESEIQSLEADNESLAKELEEYKEKLNKGSQSAQLVATNLGERIRLSDELKTKVSRLEEEKKKVESDFLTLKESAREKEFSFRELQTKLDQLNSEKADLAKNAQSNLSGLDSELKKIVTEKDNAFQKSVQLENNLSAVKDQLRDKEIAFRDLQTKLERLNSEKEDVLKNAQSSRSGLDSELKKIVTEKETANQKSAQLESNLNTLKDQLREKDFSMQKLQMNLDHAQSDKTQSQNQIVQLESQISTLKESLLAAKLISEKAGIKEEAVLEKLEALKMNFSTVSSEKEKAVTALGQAENEIESLNETIKTLNESIAQKNSESQNVAMMEAMKLMMTDMKGDLSEQIGKIKMRSGGGGGGGGNNNDSYVELDPAIILKNMFAEKFESNLGKVALDSRKAAGKKDFGKTLDALKNLKGDKKEE